MATVKASRTPNEAVVELLGQLQVWRNTLGSLNFVIDEGKRVERLDFLSADHAMGLEHTGSEAGVFFLNLAGP